MQTLINLIRTHEKWLMHRVLRYAKEHEYTQYTSTLTEAWRVSIAGLSEALIRAAEIHKGIPELNPDESYEKDPVAAFGIMEARKHRERGVRLDMFLGLMKYYRQSYLDLIQESSRDASQPGRDALFVERCFDRIEIGFCTEWAKTPETERFKELQSTNRRMTNEKNKYLTIFESLHTPVFLLDPEDDILNINHAASDLFEAVTTPGQTYYTPGEKKKKLNWLKDELSRIKSSANHTLDVEKCISTREGILKFQVKIQQMLDVSEKFSGTVVILNDVTRQKQAEQKLEQLLKEKEILLKEVHHRVKNNFNTVASLLYLQSRQIQDGQAKLFCRESRDRVQTMAEIHAQLYQSDDLSSVHFGAFVDRLVRNLFRSYTVDPSRIRIEKHIQDLDLGVDAAIPCGLIFNELISNVFKYAFPPDHKPSGRLIVNLIKEKEVIKLSVKDNGVGLPPDFNIEETPSLGLQLVKMLTEQIHGHLDFTSENGSCFTITFQYPIMQADNEKASQNERKANQ